MNDLTCAAARELLLEADPDVLRVRGESPLAQHLRACAACTAAAQHILREQASLAHALATLARGAAHGDALTTNAPGDGHADALGTPSPRATVEAVPYPSATTSTAPAEAAPTLRARRRWLAVAAPLAAAAALLLVLRQTQLRQMDVAVEPILLPQERVPDVPVVNASGAGTVAVMQTSNPNITIVWHF